MDNAMDMMDLPLLEIVNTFSAGTDFRSQNLTFMEWRHFLMSKVGPRAVMAKLVDLHAPRNSWLSLSINDF